MIQRFSNLPVQQRVIAQNKTNAPSFKASLHITPEARELINKALNDAEQKGNAQGFCDSFIKFVSGLQTRLEAQTDGIKAEAKVIMHILDSTGNGEFGFKMIPPAGQGIPETQLTSAPISKILEFTDKRVNDIISDFNEAIDVPVLKNKLNDLLDGLTTKEQAQIDEST
jgi:hypothetical protein